MGNVQMEARQIRYGSTNVEQALNNGGGGGGASTLEALTDTAISSPSNGQLLTYDSSASKWKNANAPAVAASAVSFNGTASSMVATNVQGAIDELVVNFQAGVDDVYDACVAKGSTPASHSLSDVITAIGNIPTGGGGLTQVNPFGEAQTLTLYNANGVTVTNSAIDSAGTLDFTASEASAGYEGFVIELNVTAGHTYLLEFDLQVDSSSLWAGTSYRFGYALQNDADTNYQAQAVPENIPRDYVKNSFAAALIASGSKAYVNFNVCGFSDAQTNIFSISDFKLFDIT